MRNRWISMALVVALLLTALMGAAFAEGFGDTPNVSVKLGLGERLELDTSSLLVPEGQTLQFKSSDKKIATVSNDGVVTALKKGKVTIAAGYDQTLLGLYSVSIADAPKKVTLSARNVVLSVGDTVTLNATLTKGAASALTFTSGNDSIAVVDAEGRVSAVSGGKTIITVETFNEKKAECKVYVLGGKAPTTLSLNASEVVIQVGETFKLIPSVDEGSDAYYRFASQDKKIAKVNADGEITGVKPGVTSVAVLTHNGLRQSIGVTVKRQLNDVYKCLTNEPATYLELVKKLKLTRDITAGDDTTVVCRDGELALTLSAGTSQVALNDVTDPRYCIQGIDVTMTLEAATAKLVASGWALVGSKTSDGVEQRAFIRDNDTTHYITISTADGVTIRSIAANWMW